METESQPKKRKKVRRGLKVALWSIAVILLASAFVPCGFFPDSRVESNQALNTALDLKNAIAAFREEYGQYPGQFPSLDAIAESDPSLMNILLGSEEGGNFRKTVFYIGRQASSNRNGEFRSGINFVQNGNSSLWDPWGNLYRIRMDTDDNRLLENPEPPFRFLTDTVAVWSAGRDGDFDTWEDNVKTW